MLDLKLVAVRQDGSVLDEIETRIIPDGLRHVEAINSIRVVWDDRNLSVDGYVLQYMELRSSQVPFDEWIWTTIHLPVGSPPDYTITGLTSWTNYLVRLTALQSGNPTAQARAYTRP